MRTIKPGHVYGLANFEDPTEEQFLHFIDKEKDESGNLVTVDDGTTNEEVLVMMLDRMQFLQYKAACKENQQVIVHLEASLKLLRQRTADRVRRGVEGTPNA